MRVMRNLPANRVAALVTWFSSFGALISAWLGVFPHGWQNTVLAATAVLSKLAITLHFMTGCQRADVLAANLPPEVDEYPPLRVVGETD